MDKIVIEAAHRIEADSMLEEKAKKFLEQYGFTKLKLYADKRKNAYLPHTENRLVFLFKTWDEELLRKTFGEPEQEMREASLIFNLPHGKIKVWTRTFQWGGLAVELINNPTYPKN